MNRIKNLKRYWVSLPVCYYEVFEVMAEDKKTAIAIVKHGGTESDQVCTDPNRKWSRRIQVEERPLPTGWAQWK